MSITEQLDELDPPGLLALGQEVFDRLGVAALSQLSDEQIMAAVTEAGGLEAKAASFRLRAIREVDTRGSAVAAGASSTHAWLTGVVRERPGAARRSVGMAKGLAERFAATAAALAAGEISVDHAAVICRVLESLPSTVTADEVLQAEQTLLAHAAVHDPLTLSKLGRHLAYVIDPDGEKALAAHEARLEAGRELFLSQADDGSWDLRGRLAPVPGARLFTVIDSLAAPRPSTADGPDPRTAPERRADALDEACERLLGAEMLPSQGGDRPTLLLTMTLEGLQGRVGSAAASLPGGSPLSAGQLRLLACDAKVIPLVLGGESQPLDYGRIRYTVPGHLRRAMLVRDGYRCVMRGCPNIPRVAHHIVPWHCHGETGLDNLASLCGYHHRWIHYGREHLIRAVKGGRPLVDIDERGPPS